MDYHITALKEEVVCDKIGIPDVPQLKFGTYKKYNLFNLTQYLIVIGNKEDNYRTLSRFLSGWIEAFSRVYEIPIKDMFYQNPNGDELVNGVLVYLFLICLDDKFMMYVNDLIDDVLTDGIAFSDSFIYMTARQRLSNKTLKSITNERR